MSCDVVPVSDETLLATPAGRPSGSASMSHAEATLDWPA